MIGRTYAWRNGQLVELTPQDVEALPNVMPDIKEFRSPDGKRIGGRSQWREHLKRTDSIEMGHADIKAAEAKWQNRQQAHKERVNRGKDHVKEATPPEGEIQPYERNRIGKEVANRLDQRPTPDRKTLIKLALEIRNELARRR